MFKINILFIDNNKDVTNMETLRYDDYDNGDIGDLSLNKLKEKWKMTLTQTQMSLEDKDVSDKQQNDNISEEELHNEQDELKKWRDIINNPHMSQEEKSKEKEKLKRTRYKMNKKNRIDA